MTTSQRFSRTDHFGAWSYKTPSQFYTPRNQQQKPIAPESHGFVGRWSGFPFGGRELACFQGQCFPLFRDFYHLSSQKTCKQMIILTFIPGISGYLLLLRVLGGRNAWFFLKRIHQATVRMTWAENFPCQVFPTLARHVRNAWKPYGYREGTRKTGK